MKSSLMRSRWAAIGAAVAVSLGAGAVMVASAARYPTVGDSVFTAITPCRLLDTRTDDLANKVENLGIRKGAVQSKAQGNTANNDITVIFDATAKQVGSTNTLLYDAGTSDIRPIMGDCDAQFVADGAFDTAPGSGPGLTGLQAAVPTALLLNVTTVGSTANGFVTVYPWQVLSGSPLNRPFFSNLNPIASPHPSVSNNVTVGLEEITTSPFYIGNVRCDEVGYGTSDCTGKRAFRVYNENGNTHVIIDVLGYYVGFA